MSEEEKIEEETQEEGGFFLESLSTIDAVSEADLSGGRYPKPTDSGVFSLDPNRAIRELRERQRRLEKTITILTGFILLAIVGTAVIFQTNLLDSSKDPAPVHARLNCESAKDRDSEECQTRKRESQSTWSGMERALGGKENHFSLHNH